MERKSVIMVRWKRTGKVESYSSLVAFCAAHPAYTRHRIYNSLVDGTYMDNKVELRRVPFHLNPYKTRRGGLKRAKPGPKGPRAKRN